MSSSLNHESIYAQQQQTPPSQGNTPQDHQTSAPPLPASQTHFQSQSQSQTSGSVPHLTSTQLAGTSAPAPPSSSNSRSVKRPRPVKSCTECRKRKLRCDRLCPCSQCQKAQRACKYAGDNDPTNLSDVSDAEGAGDGQQARPAKARCFVPASEGLLQRGVELSSSSMTAALPLLEEMSDRMERLEKHIMGRSPSEITESAGSHRYETKKSNTHNRIEIPPATLKGLSSKYGGRRTRYHGPRSTRVLMDLFEEAKEFMRDHPKDPNAREVFSSFRKLHRLLRTEFQKSLTPISVFVDSMMPIQKRMVDILPKRHVCDRLLRAYLSNNETIYRVIHAPTFLAQYNNYWEGTPQSEHFLPMLLSILSIASRFETKSRGLGHEISEGVHLPTAAALVRLWMNDLRGKQLAEIETLQTEILWLLTVRMIKENGQDGWAQLGSILRMAMAMGLHRDPSEFGDRITPFNGEIRRRLWATIADLNYFVSNECDLPSLLRAEDSTCGAPRNLDDADIYPDMKELPAAKPFDVITDNHIQAYAATTYGLRMQAASLVSRIETVKDWSEVLEVASKLEQHIENIDLVFPNARPRGDAGKARLWRCRCMLTDQVREPLVSLYRPYVLGVPNVPPQILRAYLRHSVAVLNEIEELDPSMPDYEAVLDLTHLGTKNDALQAALTMCYFIRAIMRPSDSCDPASQSVQRAMQMSEDDSELPLLCTPDGAAWPTTRLIRNVEKINHFLIQNIKRGDTKDIVCLSLILESVRSPEPRAADMTHGLRVVLDSCLQAANCTLERLASSQSDATMQQQQGEPYGMMRLTAGAGYPRPDHKRTASSVSHQEEEDEGWMFWDGLD